MSTSFPLIRPEPATYHLAVALGLLMVLVLVQPARGVDLRAYQWKHRLLLIFAPNATDPRLMAFEKRIAARHDEVQDRDLLIFRLLEAGVPGHPDAPTTAADVEALRHRYKVPTGRFSVVLIGKDGGLKQVQEEHVSLQAIFDLIDTMPMRRQEMRQKDTARRAVNGG